MVKSKSKLPDCFGKWIKNPTDRCNSCPIRGPCEQVFETNADERDFAIIEAVCEALRLNKDMR